MLSCNFETLADPLSESETALKFLKSLQELRELRSQIHYAADYCEASFKEAHEKKPVMDNTREYICRAVVTVVDHLGSVSANLESRLKENDVASKAQVRINCLKQKVLLHGEYKQALLMSKLGPRVEYPRHFPRYLVPSTSNEEKPEEQSSGVESCDEADDSITKKKKHEQKLDEDLPLFIYTNANTSNRFNYNIPLYRSPSESNALQSLASVFPVRDGLSVPPQTKRVAFHFQMVRKHGRRILQWRMQDNDIVSRIRRGKKESLKLLKL